MVELKEMVTSGELPEAIPTIKTAGRAAITQTCIIES